MAIRSTHGPHTSSLLRANELASHELRRLVGEVLDIVHDDLQRRAASSLLEVGHAAPLKGGLDGVGRVVAELEDLHYVSQQPDMDYVILEVVIPSTT